jgi:hypothetical protein
VRIRQRATQPQGSVERVVIDHHGTTLERRWVTEHGENFPMRVEVQVDESFQTVAMDANGADHLTLPS